MKKVILSIFIFLFILTSCTAKKNFSEISKDVFSNEALVNSFNVNWLFLPEKAIVIRNTETCTILQVDFKGCEAAEINEYAEDLFNELQKMHCTVFSFDVISSLKPAKITEFKKSNISKDFAGTAYAYCYIIEEQVYLLEIKYYGCGAGTYGNGQSSVSITDVTDAMYYLIEE